MLGLDPDFFEVVFGIKQVGRINEGKGKGKEKRKRGKGKHLVRKDRWK